MDRYTTGIDIQRLLQGEVPWEFYVELIIRAVAVYLILIVALRLMGKRMSRMFTRNELAAVATLAAAIGIPLQSPDRGIIPGVLIAGIVIVAQRWVAQRATKSQRFERTTQGRISTLVQDGCLQIKDLNECNLSRERVFSQLRGTDITHLGQVKRLYLEASGSFTLIKNQQPASGLCILPEWDMDFISEQQPDHNIKVCSHCGNGQQQKDTATCANCKNETWLQAIR